ncbi:MAG TPA: rhamnulokinase family protein [Anaerolineae bacterium]
MSQTLNYVALDLGAESGRAILGAFDGERIDLSQVHRFPTGGVRVSEPAACGDGLHWDALRLWSEIKTGIGLAAAKIGGPLASAGLDTWGVDYGLLDRQGVLIGNPYHYRNSRTDGMMAEAFRRVPREAVFAATGIQFMQLNTLYQLLAAVLGDSPALASAKTYLGIPDLFNYWLSGRAVCEFSHATTTQCYDPRARGWATSLLASLGIPTGIFPEIVPSASLLGEMLPAVAEETGTPGLAIVAPACHDTGSAVAAVPATDPDFVWISSGTWSIMGIEAQEPIITDRSLRFNFTNEGGARGTIRFSKNITGLWLVQECRRTWASQGQDLSYEALTGLARQARPLQSVIDPDYDDFLKPGDMPARIASHCRRSGQPVPEDKGAMIRCVLEGLALKYRHVLEGLEEMAGRRLGPIHIIGGGTQNRLLCQFTADATGRPVIAGPVEATATGNLLLQAIALGHLASLADLRRVVRNSFAVETYEPGPHSGWDDAYDRFKQLMPADNSAI